MKQTVQRASECGGDVKSRSLGQSGLSSAAAPLQLSRVEFVHSRSFIHRDIKVCAAGSDSGGPVKHALSCCALMYSQRPELLPPVPRSPTTT